MRVAYVCTDPGIPVFGRKGVSVHVQAVLRVLLARGAELHLLAARIGGDPPSGLETVRVHRLPEIGPGSPVERERKAKASDAAVATVLDEVAKAGPLDLVYERYALWGRTATLWAAVTSTPSILEVNAPLVDEQVAHRSLADRVGAERVVVSAISSATAVVCVSDEVAAWARRITERPDRVHTVRNGVDPQRIVPAKRAVTPASGTPFTVGFLGTLKPWHGVDVLLDAMALLASDDDSYRLLIIGEGPQAPALRQRAERAGIAPLVEMTGLVDPGDVPTLLHRIDVAAAPYPPLPVFYFSPLKVFEYLAAGLPIVASRVGQLVQVLDEGRLGVLVEPGDSTALAAAVEGLRADPDRRVALGRSARDAAVTRHTWDASVDRMLTLVGARAAVPRAAGRSVAARG